MAQGEKDCDGSGEGAAVSGYRLSSLASLQADRERMNEPEKKADVLNAFEVLGKEHLERWRREARHYCHQNKGFVRYGVAHSISIDVIREHFDITALPGGSNNLLGSVFRRGFIKLWPITSKTKGRHASMIWLWTTKEYEAAARASIGQK